MRAEGIGMDFSREKALAYAHRWAFGRNPEYLAFDRLGGDCTSFVSQCLLAGGAPEDPTPLWGWYYRSGNDKAPAWSGVEPFWRDVAVGAVLIAAVYLDQLRRRTQYRD